MVDDVVTPSIEPLLIHTKRDIASMSPGLVRRPAPCISAARQGDICSCRADATTERMGPGQQNAHRAFLQGATLEARREAWWSGAGSNRRPSDFSHEHLLRSQVVQLGHVQSTCTTGRLCSLDEVDAHGGRRRDRLPRIA